MATAPVRSKIFDRQEQIRIKKLALLREASRIFNERGFGSSSLDEIAGQLNLTKAALYYYFKSKQEILFECYLMSFAIADEAIDYATNRGSTGRQQLEIYVRRYMEAGLNELSPTINLRESEALDQRFRNKINDRRIQVRGRLRDIITRGIADGSIAKCDPALMVSCMAGIISWLFRVYDQDGKLSPTEMADATVTLLANGFVPRDVRPKKRNRS
jgi:AcrR family transcriptional regulator